MDEEFLRLAAEKDRREILYELMGGTGEEEVATFHDHVSKASLVHHHLPMLDDSGVVDWDRGEGVVEQGDRFDEIRPLLEFLREQ